MPKGRLITRSVTHTRPISMTLNLDCSEEPLSESQLAHNAKLKENYDKVAGTLEEVIKERGGQLLCQAGAVQGYQYTLPGNAPQPAIVKPSQSSLLNPNQAKSQPIKLNMLSNPPGNQGNIQLVMDPRMGVILGAVTQQQSTPPTTQATPSPVVSSQSTNENYKYTRSGRRTKVLQVQQPDIMEELPTPVSRTRGKTGTPTHVVTPTTTSPQGVTNLRIKTVPKQQQQQQQQQQQPQQKPAPIIVRPTEHTSIGGISVGNKNASGEQIEESKRNLPDGREITFNKMNGGRTFPSLVVVARPNLCTKDITPQLAQAERTELDVKVKSVLMYSATKFAEWLIQQGLVRSEQYCNLHSSNYQKTKLKLGMYSDSGTFPYSGGYVWISSCCPDRFVSVFSGSIFQGAPHTPTVLLKLIYHWACQTNVQNVVSWVKVSNVYVKNFYTNLRSICTAAVWDKSCKMGGKNSMVQVGVISLGTTSQDGNLRQVKVEVLGILNLETQEIRLRACDPVHDGDRSFKRRFHNILNPLRDWVHKESKILTDYTVDKSTLQEMGFHNVMQSAFSEQNPRNTFSNYHIMEYLRKIVPRMFQNTLSLLSRQMIQQFLDDLVWREMFGKTAARAFDNIIIHIAEQTRIDSPDCLLDRLAKIAANPFQDWSYSNLAPPQLAPMVSIPKEPVSNNAEIIQTITQVDLTRNNNKPGPKRNRKRLIPSKGTSPEPEVKRSTPELRFRDRENKGGDNIQLQEYYYATMEGDKNRLLDERKSSINMKCFLCTTIMRSNTEVMEHMVTHVRPQVPGQKESPVCRYCCAVFSSKHQMTTHVSEAHSTMGRSANGDMVVCAICEEKFVIGTLLANHMAATHYPSEMPYRCETCGYRSSSHKDVIDHYYKIHEKGDGLMCPYCLKVIQFCTDGNSGTLLPVVHAYLLHMQRHSLRREEGRGNKCRRCCLWFNQKSALITHQKELHIFLSSPKIIPYIATENGIMIPRPRNPVKRIEIDSPIQELPNTENVKTWSEGPIRILAPPKLACQECEEDIDELEHYPGEQKCLHCKYSTCCWRAFKEHQQQFHNARPLTGLAVLSPLLNIPLENKMQCPCGFSSVDGNQLATHLIKCKRISAYPTEDSEATGMLDSLGLVPKNIQDDLEGTNSLHQKPPRIDRMENRHNDEENSVQPLTCEKTDGDLAMPDITVRTNMELNSTTGINGRRAKASTSTSTRFEPSLEDNLPEIVEDRLLPLSGKKKKV
ncbi:uncharacterized protein row isoform X2 [Neodiprion pinetum]|uniref:uncharacterized protein row isoform X2 n=1 Tax=Neodiprion pinetum TaxID=441929 RepID=UPI001EE05774|nr:uncharacterized protein LOC124215317 isoform X2 [Neodiprion pinetum]